MQKGIRFFYVNPFCFFSPSCLLTRLPLASENRRSVSGREQKGELIAGNAGLFTVYFPGLLEIPNSIHIQIQQIFL